MLRKWCEVTSCNGVIDLYHSKNSTKSLIFWILVMTLMTIASVFFTYKTILNYILSPSVTNVVTVPQSLMEMPDTMICYNGGLNVTAMQAAGWSSSLITEFSLILLNSITNSDDKVVEEFEQYLIKNNIDVKQVIETFGYQCEDMVSLFRIDTESRNCSSDSDRLLTTKGKCYMFRNVSNQYYPNIWAGIAIKLKAPRNSFYEVFKNQTGEYINSDFSITMEKRLGMQQTWRSITIPVNVKAEITLNTKRYVRLSTFGECDDDPTLYSSNTCFYRCYLTEITKACQCSELDYWNENDTPVNVSICNPLTFANVCFPHYDKMACQRCQRNCKPLCDEWLFENTISYSFLDTERLNEPVSVVSIGYNTMQYTKIEEVAAYSMDMAIANVGGQSGLWLGASFLTIIQGFYYLCLAANKKLTCYKTEVQFHKSKNKPKINAYVNTQPIFKVHYNT